MDQSHNVPAGTRDPSRADAKLRVKQGRSGSSLVWIVLIFLATFAIWEYRSQRTVLLPPETRPLNSLSTRDANAQVAIAGILGGAKAGEIVITANEKKRLEIPGVEVPLVYVSAELGQNIPETERLPKSNSIRGFREAAIKIEKVRSKNPFRKRDEALTDTIQQAREKIQDVLSRATPPVEITLTDAKVRGFLVEKSVREILPDEGTKKLWLEKGLESDRLWVEAEFEVSSEQVRRLRSEQRLHQVGLVMAGILGVCLLLLGFLKLDALTKGYLTYTLGGLTILLILGVIIFLTVLS
jgi:hypothetical protein